MKTSLVPLGTNGFIPSFGRQTMSFLLLGQKDVLLMDAGTGLSRLLDPKLSSLLENYDTLNIILSHYHLDHVVGLSYLPGIWSGGPVRIYGPAKPIVDTDPKDALNKLLHPPLFTLTLEEFPMPIEIIPITEDEIQISGFSIKTRRQKHPGGSMGIRIDNKLAYTTDTVVDPETVLFAKGVELLLHEVWLTDAEAQSDAVERSRHSYASGVAEIATSSGAGRLMLVHHHPKRSEEDLQELGRAIQASTKVDVIVPVEGHFYDLG